MHDIKMTTGSSPLSTEKINGRAKFVSTSQDFSEYKDVHEQQRMVEKLFKEKDKNRLIQPLKHS